MILGLGYHRFAMVTNAKPETLAGTVLRDPNWYSRGLGFNFFTCIRGSKIECETTYE